MITHRTAAIRSVPIILGLILLVGVGSAAQHQRTPPTMETTDDPRRVPVPPRDRSKDPVLVLRGGTVIDGTDSAPIAGGVVVIQGDRIVDVGPAGRVRIPGGVDETVDVTGLHVVPGLIDLHIHFRQQRGEDFARYRDSEAAIAIRGVEKLGQFLDGGITAVRDLGGPGDAALKLKEAVERRIFPGPRVFWAGQMIATRGGHSDEITETASGRPRPLTTNPGVRVATGPWDWRLAVREQIRLGVDVIKITAPFTREEVAAAVDEAHLHGIRVTADAFGEFTRWAAEAGIDAIEHPLDLSEAVLNVMKAHGTALVPTMTAFYNPLTFGYPSAAIPPGGFFYTMSRRYEVTHKRHLEMLSRARMLGVKVGIGTDIPFENETRYPADYFTELGFFKEAGYSDREILLAATRTGAEILDLADKLGTLKPGMLADVLVVAGDPLKDYRNLQNMRLVVADGRVVRNRITPRGATSAAASADPLVGTWELTSYESPASFGAPSGQIIFTEQRFSLIYSMQGASGAAKGPSWGRAHAGRYRVSGTELRLQVDWSMEHTPGGSAVARTPAERRTLFSIEGNVLTIRFDNGAVQRFRRVTA